MTKQENKKERERERERRENGGEARIEIGDREEKKRETSQTKIERAKEQKSSKR